MKNILLTLSFFVLSQLLSNAQSTTVVISQVYGGGGSASGTFNADYVELHNISSVSQDISGYYLMYGSATGNLASSTGNSYIFPAGTSIPAGGYVLVATVAGTGLANLPVSPDFIFLLTISGTNGKVAFGTSAMLQNTPVSSQPAGSIIDLVGYGTANAFEGTALATLNSTSAAIRNNNGCDETDNNQADFTILTPSPRNSSSQVNVCGVTPVNPTLFASSLASFGNTCITGTSVAKSFNLSGAALQSGSITIGPLAPFTFNDSATGVFTSTMTISQNGGTLPSTTIFVKFTPSLVQTYAGNIPVSGGGAPAITVAASGVGVDATTVTTGAAGFIITNAATLSAQISYACDTVSAYGFEYSTTNNFTFGTGTRVNASGVSAGNFSASLSGLSSGITYYFAAFITTPRGTSFGTRGSFTTNTSVNGGSSVVISQFYGAGGNPGAIYNADYVELHNLANVPQTITGYTIQYGSATVASTWSGKSRIPVATIPAGGYYLIQLTSPGTNGTALPTPDYLSTTAVSMSATSGRLALISDTSTASGCVLPARTLDLVGYGLSSCFEGSVGTAPLLDSVSAAFRNNFGCTDNNDNTGDFSKATPLPRNSISTPYLCSAPACSTNTWNGTVSRAWENAANWSCGTVPNASTIVLIPSGLTNYPEVRSNAFCKKIQTSAGAKVDVITGFTLKLEGN